MCGVCPQFPGSLQLAMILVAEHATTLVKSSKVKGVCRKCFGCFG